MSVEMEVSLDQGQSWQKIGFETVGGFNPYRYEYKQDAEWTAFQLYPMALRRVVPATTLLRQEEH